MSDERYLPLIEGMVWSYSRLTCFEDCKYRFFMKYIHEPKLPEEEKFYASYGSFVHKIIEGYYRNEIPRSELSDVYLNGFSEQVIGTRPNKNTLEKYIAGGAAYFRDFEPFKYEMVDVEKYIEFEIRGFKFKAYIDYIGLDDDNLVIIDHKAGDIRPRSGRKKPTVKDQKLNEKLRQLYIYSAGVLKEYGKLPTKLCYNCYRTGLFIEEPFVEKDYLATLTWATNLVEEIKHTEFFNPDVSWFKCCNICELSKECEYWEASEYSK